MSEAPDNTGQVRRSRASDGGAPVTGALAIVLAAVAVVAGFLILRSITDDGTATSAFPGSGAGDGVGTTVDQNDAPLPPCHRSRPSRRSPRRGHRLSLPMPTPSTAPPAR